jgi:site-specific recombinase XerD
MTKSSPPTLQQLLGWQIQNLATVLMPATIVQYRGSASCFLSYLQTAWPEVSRASQLRRDPHILGWLRDLYEHQPPYANRTRMDKIICVRRLLHDLTASSDPPREDLFAQGDCPPHDKYLPKPLSPEDDRLLRQQLRQRANLRSDAFLLIRATGMRIGECLKLRVDSLRELGENQWAVHVPLGKLHSERWVPVDDEACALFRHILSLRFPAMPGRGAEPSPFLLHQKNGKIPSYSAMRTELRSAARDGGCSILPTPHQLRHTYATTMLRAGASLPVVKELLGHRAIEMTMRYVQVSQIDLQREYHRARQSMGALHAIPKLQRTLTTGPSAVRELLSQAAHFMEMYRRQLNDEKTKRKIQRLANRLQKIQTELRLPGEDEK